MARMRFAVCLLGVAALIASCGQNQPVGSGSDSVGTLPHATAGADTIVLPYGETVILEPENLEVTFDSVVHDSRCPSDVVCIWEGIAIIELELVAALGDTHWVELASPGDAPWGTGTSVDTLGHTFKLLSVDPYPVSTSQIPLPDYVITLSIVESEPVESITPDVTVPSRSTKTDDNTLSPAPVPSAAE